MILTMSGHDFHFELENISRMFLQQEKIQTIKEGEPCPPPDGVWADTRLERGEQTSQLFCRLRLDDFDQSETATVPNDHPGYRDECELQMATLLYHLFVKLFGFTQEWGILTGVRPVKLLRRLVRDDGETAALRYFRERLLVNEQKTELCRRTLAIEDDILALSRPESFSLYVSIPFCPTRCDYCSFVSQTVEKAARLMPAYVEALVQEIAYTGELARQLGLRLETVYFGGGTPTTLTAEQLARLLAAVEQSFDLSTVREYTVEAGRPDTVTPEKLQAIRAAGVSRISINPQTLQDSVLQTIGRRHTVEQFYNAFDMARRAGCDHINTDLIAGLPGDTVAGFIGAGTGKHNRAYPFDEARFQPCDPASGGLYPAGGRGAYGGAHRLAAAGGGLSPVLPVSAKPHGRQPGKCRLGQAGARGTVQRLYHG